ncbi:hypothetical protein ACTS9T_03640 [Empedobacter falsenii]
MSQFGIIIQETTSGLNFQYHTKDIDLNHPDIKETTQDERILATQLVNQSKFYSVEITENYKVYTYVNPNVSDDFGRSGYYTIKLYFKNKFIKPNNLISLFYKIEAKYLEYKLNNNLASQEYEMIQNLFEGEDGKKFIYLKENKQFVVYFDPTNLDSLTEKLNDEKVFIIKKLYAFNIAKSLGEEQVKSFGLIPLNELRMKIARFDNSDHILKEITYNNAPVSFRNLEQSNFQLKYPSDFGGALKYSTHQKNNLPVAEFNELRKPVVIKTKPPVTPPSRKSNTPILIGSLVGVLVLGVAGYIGYDYFYSKDKEQALELNYTSTDNSINIIKQELEREIKITKFPKDSYIYSESKKDSQVVRNDYYQIDDPKANKLKSYYFKNKDENSVEYYSSFDDLKSNTNMKKIEASNLKEFFGEISINTTDWDSIVLEANENGLKLPKLSNDNTSKPNAAISQANEGVSERNRVSQVEKPVKNSSKDAGKPSQSGTEKGENNSNSKENRKGSVNTENEQTKTLIAPKLEK